MSLVNAINMYISKYIMKFLAKDFFLTLVNRHLCVMVVLFVSLLFKIDKHL